MTESNKPPLRLPHNDSSEMEEVSMAVKLCETKSFDKPEKEKEPECDSVLVTVAPFPDVQPVKSPVSNPLLTKSLAKSGEARERTRTEQAVTRCEWRRRGIVIIIQLDK